MDGDELRSQEDNVTRPQSEVRFRLHRWQEDYLWLSRKTEPLSDYERLKYIPLGSASENYLSLGGEVRYRFDQYQPYLFGLTSSGRAWASHQERLSLHADLHLSRHFRFFTQIDAAKEDGRPTQRSYDQSAPDLRQAFGDLKVPVGAGTVTLRAGRQDLWLGPSRWLSLRDGGNIIRTFDGGLVEYRSDDLIVRAFAARPVSVGPGLFDDATSQHEWFRGVYATVRRPISLPITVDAYLLGKQDNDTFTRGSGNEDRWTVGTRVAGTMASLAYTAELAYQFGRFGTAHISAWGAYGNISYSESSVPLAPRVGLRGHYASGDRDPTGSTLRTFSGPYPASAEVSGTSLLSVSNMFNLEPYLQLRLSSVVLGTGWNMVWRASTADAVYASSGTLIKAPGSQARDVAQVAHLYFTWDVNRFVQVHGFYSHTFAGGYIKDANGRDFDYYRLRVRMRF
jgi:Alginate export